MNRHFHKLLTCWFSSISCKALISLRAWLGIPSSSLRRATFFRATVSPVCQVREQNKNVHPENLREKNKTKTKLATLASEIMRNSTYFYILRFENNAVGSFSNTAKNAVLIHAVFSYLKQKWQLICSSLGFLHSCWIMCDLSFLFSLLKVCLKISISSYIKLLT